MKLASRFKRLVAFLLDCGITIAISSVLFGFALSSLASSPYIFSIAELIPAFVYYSIFEQSKYQATPGKMLFKLYVATSNNKRISLGQAIFRYVLFITPNIPIIYLIFGHTSVLIMADDTQFLSMIRSMPNSLFYLLTSFILMCIWYIPILLKSRRGMHDRISDTVVLSK